MDFSSVLKNEIFRPLATVFVPGATAIGPWVLIFGHYSKKVRWFWDLYPTAVNVMIFVAVLAAGLILEDLGSRIEITWDKCLIAKNPGRKGQWKQYLQLNIQDELVAQRFLRTIYIRFKFELSMSLALVSFTIGVIWLNSIQGVISTSSMAWIATILLGLAGYLLFESYASSDHLAELHEYIIEAPNLKK